MILKQLGNEIKPLGYNVIQDLQSLTASVEVIDFFPFQGEMQLCDDNNERDFVVFRHYLNRDRRKISVLYPKKFIELITQDSMLPSFKGEYTTEELLNAVGIDYISRFATDKVFWNIPRLTLRPFIEHLELYTQVNNGGGCYLNFTLDGKVQVSDLKTAFDKKDGVFYLTGKVDQLQNDYTWIIDTPSNYKLIQNTPEERIERDIVLIAGLGSKTIEEFIPSIDYKDLLLRKVTNQFYKKYFTSTHAHASIRHAGQTYLSARITVDGANFLISAITWNSSGKSQYTLIT